MRIPVAARSKTWVWGRTFAGIVGSNLAGGMDMFLVSVVCCQVDVSASAWSLIQRSPTECGVSECDREVSLMRKPWPTRDCRAVVKKKMKELPAAKQIAQHVGYMNIMSLQSIRNTVFHVPYRACLLFFSFRNMWLLREEPVCVSTILQPAGPVLPINDTEDRVGQSYP